MSFDLGQLFSPAGLLCGVAIGVGVLPILEKKFFKNSDANVGATATEALVKLQAELDASKDDQAKVEEVHAYARQLEEKIQQLESTTDSADSELRVKVLEKQLSEKADLESRLAIALQQLEDYKAKAEMYDTVMGGSTPKPVEAAAPVAEPEPVVAEEVVAEEVVAEEAPAEQAPAEELPEKVVAEEEVEAPAAAEDPVFVEEETALEEVAAAPATVETVELEAPAAEKEEEALTAVASADSAVEIKLVETAVPVTNLSPAGSVAPAIEERPALRVEAGSEPLTASTLDPSDPLEKIEGIGQVYQAKLYEAGIKTFAQLAAASPSRITEIIEPQNWQQIDVMKWRREAALYASGEKA